jgi:hypothetical protein
MWYMPVTSPFSLLFLTRSSRVMEPSVWEILSLTSDQRSRLAQVLDRGQEVGFFTQSTRQVSPSRMSTISLSVMAEGCLANVYPPWAPRVEVTNPAALRGMMMRLRYFSEIYSSLAMSLRKTCPLLLFRANSSMSLTPYRDRVESFIRHL